MGIVMKVNPSGVIHEGIFGVQYATNRFSNGPRIDCPFFLSPAKVVDILRHAS